MLRNIPESQKTVKVIFTIVWGSMLPMSVHDLNSRVAFAAGLFRWQGMPIMKSLSVVVMPTHMLPGAAAPMAPGTMSAYFDQIEVRCDFSSVGD